MPRPSVPLSARLLLPIFRHELPGWGRVLHAAKFNGAADHPMWRTAGRATVREKLHGYRLDLDLAEWSQRYTWLLGRYYDLATQQLVTACLRPGENAIDAGANIGMITLHAAATVAGGPSRTRGGGGRSADEVGRVYSFEPNPASLDRVRQTLADNGITNVDLRAAGLSDAPGELTLSVMERRSGMATLADVWAEDEAKVSARVTVPVLTGDAALAETGAGPIHYVKVDVEGFELRVLRGLAGTLERDRPVVSCEVDDGHLMRAGAKRADLFDLMSVLGYRPFALSSHRRRGAGHRLRLRPVDDPAGLKTADAAFVHPDTAGWERLRPFVA